MIVHKLKKFHKQVKIYLEISRKHIWGDNSVITEETN